MDCVEHQVGGIADEEGILHHNHCDTLGGTFRHLPLRALLPRRPPAVPNDSAHLEGSVLDPKRDREDDTHVNDLGLSKWGLGDGYLDMRDMKATSRPLMLREAEKGSTRLTAMTGCF